MIELAGDANRVREVEMAEPADIDAWHGEDRIGIVDARLGFDQCDHQSALVGTAHLVLDIAAAVIIMRQVEGEAAHALGPIAAPGGNLFGLFLGLDHRHHDAHGARVEHRRDQVVMRTRHAHHRHQADPARGGDLLLDRLDADAAMLHVEDAEFGARRGEDLRHAGAEELECHDAERRLAAPQLLPYRISLHAPRSSRYRPFGMVTRTLCAAAASCRSVSSSRGMPRAFRSARSRRSISPGSITRPPGSIGGEAPTHSARRSISAANAAAPAKAAGAKMSGSKVLTSAAAGGVSGGRPAPAATGPA